MWRKTRSVNAGAKCIGVDGNRNFDAKFGGEGTSSDSCSDIYRGPRVFSEKETTVVKNYVTPLALANRVIVYYAVHTYSQLILLPYGWSSGAKPNNFAEIVRKSKT